MRADVKVFSLLVLAALSGCGGKSKVGGSKGPSAAVEQDSSEVRSIGTVGWLFQGFPYPFKEEHGNDAVVYTHGSMLLKSVPVIDGFALKEEDKVLSASLYVKRYLLLRPVSGAGDVIQSLSVADRDFLTTYCQNINVTLPGGGTTGTLAEEIFEIRWKSHFQTGNSEKLALLLLAAKADFRCGVEFGMAYAGATATNFMSLPFEPAPDFDPTKTHPADLYAGTDRFVSAKDGAILLPEVRSQKLDAFENTWQKTEIDGVSDISVGVYALNADDFAAEPVESVDGDPCDLRLTDKLKVMNPTVVQTVTFKLPAHAKRNYILKSAGYSTIAGLVSPEVCKALTFKVLSADTFSYSATCAQVKEVVDVGLCGARLSITNPDDADNTADVKITLGGLKYTQLDLGKPVNAASLLLPVAANPVRDDLITMTQFSPGQELELARSFDLWQTVSTASYDSFFKNKITEMLYDNGGPNCDGAGAYAYLNSDKVYWCPGGGLNADALTAAKSPYYLVYRATTALHEALHAKGNPHDIDAPGNPACSSDGGTAYAAVVAVDTYECAEDFCYGFKELAREEFILELNYSLKNDARRFTGQCDIWAKKLGVNL